MKKLLSLTAAALLLITTGCGRSNAPPASASSGTPSVSAPITEPTVESSDDTTPTVQKDEAAAKPQNRIPDIIGMEIFWAIIWALVLIFMHVWSRL